MKKTGDGHSNLVLMFDLLLLLLALDLLLCLLLLLALVVMMMLLQSVQSSSWQSCSHM